MCLTIPMPRIRDMFLNTVFQVLLRQNDLFFELIFFRILVNKFGSLCFRRELKRKGSFRYETEITTRVVSFPV